jgi:hypothetical protein
VVYTKWGAIMWRCHGPGSRVSYSERTRLDTFFNSMRITPSPPHDAFQVEHCLFSLFLCCRVTELCTRFERPSFVLLYALSPSLLLPSSTSSSSSYSPLLLCSEQSPLLGASLVSFLYESARAYVSASNAMRHLLNCKELFVSTVNMHIIPHPAANFTRSTPSVSRGIPSALIPLRSCTLDFPDLGSWNFHSRLWVVCELQTT